MSSLGFGQRDPHAKACVSDLVSEIQFDISVQLFRNGADDGKPESRARARAAQDTIKRVEHARALCERYAWVGVAHEQDDDALVAGYAQIDSAAFRRVADGIVYEVANEVASSTSSARTEASCSPSNCAKPTRSAITDRNRALVVAAPSPKPS